MTNAEEILVSNRGLDKLGFSFLEFFKSINV